MTQKEDSFLPGSMMGRRWWLQIALLWNLLSSSYHTFTDLYRRDLYRRDAYIFYGLFSVTMGQSAPVTDPWDVGTFVPPTNWQWHFPLTLQLTSQAALPRCAWHGTATSIGWQPQVWMICFFVFFFSFFICLDSCSRNSAGVWCQQRISTLAQRPAALRKHVLVGLITLSTWITIFLETSPKGKTLPKQWVRVSSSQEMSMKSLLIWT